MLELLFPTLRATATEEELDNASVPGPVNPPKVAAVSDPKLRNPLPLVSSVLSCKARGLPKASVPPSMSVLPVKEFVPPRVSAPPPIITNVPVPETGPESVTAWPAVLIAPPPLATSATGSPVENPAQACSVPPLRFKSPVPALVITEFKMSNPPLRL